MELGPKGMRFMMNLYPPYLVSRTRVKYIAPDWRELIVELPKSLLTRNYVGTTFGGSLYAACDPFFMLMFVKIFGIKDYIIWDKGAVIDFKKPARSKVTYRVVITDDDLKKIHDELAANGKSVPELHVKGVDAEGDVCITVKKIVYIRKKQKN